MVKVLGIRWCTVDEAAAGVAATLDRLGLPRQDGTTGADEFTGAVFPAGESWVELWPTGPDMPALTMLQIVVDDADAFAAHGRSQGLEIDGPHDAHDELIYTTTAPNGLAISFQSTTATD